MIPSIAKLNTTLEEVSLPSNTYKILTDKDRVSGYSDGLDAIKQTIYLILSTERYAYPIYSWNYGVELADLIGQPTTYVVPELKRRITEALMQDDRITSVSDFQFSVQKNIVNVSFVVSTTMGQIDEELEVRI